ncbi:hypothetical protein FVEN_g12870 [Fusarium venenatum]|uniref:Uncharacterized protein n=1 Tax=Fusarium venenatum TaxID=56646 RepID=A0A2L2SVK3_9HYPO|nr:uncharacterized protein FVRRES_04835 [Fusarium venenatum]KAG8355538.1 hypothetical protein FVEN_g12870 [Fusarium venenatum]CEI60399.1 unnamed protein product [Fusarium venenatum]
MIKDFEHMVPLETRRIATSTFLGIPVHDQSDGHHPSTCHRYTTLRNPNDTGKHQKPGAAAPSTPTPGPKSNRQA